MQRSATSNNCAGFEMNLFFATVYSAKMLLTSTCIGKKLFNGNVRSCACAGAQSSCISVHPGAAELRRNFGLLCQSNLSIPVSFHKVDASEDCNCSLQDGSFFLLKMTFYVNDAQ
jgi:hypothetical protein